MSEPMGMADAAGVARDRALSIPRHALDRPVAGWSEQGLHAVMTGPAYGDPQHPRHDDAQRMVREWYRQRYGSGPAPVDATGRIIAGAPTRRPTRAAASTDGGCPVPVRAHEREGDRVQVDQHCRAKPT